MAARSKALASSRTFPGQGCSTSAPSAAGRRASGPRRWRAAAWASSIPGQALAYKIGEMKLKELRARATEALGGRFDVRRFHDAVLLEGAMPLAMLERRIDGWIEAEKKGP